MKPIEVRMINFGPFRDERVDFTGLDEIFLLCGDTGAGKTTVFDAMAFALYGNLLGSRKGHARDAVCEFAPPDEEASVVFTFALRGETFRVRRTLPRVTVNKRGKETTRESTVALERRRGEEASFEAVLGGKRETDEYLQSLIGLTYEQFTKVVILPQGDFADFLRAKSKEKTDILKKIFPIDFYERVSSLAHEKATEARANLQANERELKQLVLQRDFSHFEEDMKELQQGIAAKRGEQQSIQAQREGLSADIKLQEERLKEARERDEAKGRLKAMVAQQKQVEQTEHKIEMAQSAQKVKPYDEAQQQAKREVDELGETVRRLEGQSHTLEERLASLEQKRDGMTAREAAIPQKKVELEDARRQVELLQKVEHSEASLKAAQDKLQEGDQRMASFEGRFAQKEASLRACAKDALSPSVDIEEASASRIVQLLTGEKGEAQKRVIELQHSFDSAAKADGLERRIEQVRGKTEETEHKVEEAEKQHEAIAAILADFEAQKTQRDDSEMACHLAETLKEGSPCPVCGSTSHPAPAHGAAQSLDLDDKIASQKIALEDSAEKMHQLKADLVSLQTQAASLEEQLTGLGECPALSDAKQQLDEAKEHFRALSDALEVCEKLESECEKIEREIERLKESLLDCQKDEASKKAELDTLQEQVGSQSDIREVREHIARLESEIASDEKECAAFKKSLDATRIESAKTAEALSQTRSSLAAAGDRLEEATRRLNAVLEETGFESAQEARQWLLSGEEVAAMQQDVDTFYSQLTTLTAQVNSLAKKSSESQEAIDQTLTQKRGELARLASSYDSNEAALSKLETDAANLTSSHERYLALKDEHATLSAQAGPLGRLDDDLNGKNPKKLKFETWFLGVYFADVVESANHYFAKISSGRYEFKLDTDSSGGNRMQGLDLLVCDWQNGTERSTETLSGGETFMASISLALGLTQVINAGNVALDSLFIDEGFGSLDRAALDTAVAILQEVGEGRIVGVISHVEEMRATIASKVEVVKTPQGSHIVQ